MKKAITLILLILGILSIALLGGCSQTADQELAAVKANVTELKKEVSDAMADAHEANQELAWLKFKTEAKDRIAANDRSISEYKVKMTTTNGTRRDKYDKKIDALELKNKELKAKLDNYPEGGKNSWEQFKNEFSRDMDELGSALKDFAVNNKK